LLRPPHATTPRVLILQLTRYEDLPGIELGYDDCLLGSL